MADTPTTKGKFASVASTQRILVDNAEYDAHMAKLVDSYIGPVKDGYTRRVDPGPLTGMPAMPGMANQSQLMTLTITDTLNDPAPQLK